MTYDDSQDMPLEQRPHDLYRIFDDQDRLLYIGCALHWDERIHFHEALRRQNTVSDEICHRAFRIEVTAYPNRAAGRAAEKAAIKAEMPYLNREHNGQRFRRVRGVGYVPIGEVLPPMTEAEVSRGFESFLLNRLTRQLERTAA